MVQITLWDNVKIEESDDTILVIKEIITVEKNSFQRTLIEYKK